MIHLYTEETLPTFTESWQDTYIRSRFLAYGSKERFAPFFCDEKGRMLSLLDGNGVLNGISTENTAEWAAFFSMNPYITKLTADISIATELARILQKPMILKKIMRLETPLSKPDILLTEPSPRQMYPLLSTAFGEDMPAFDGWYVDVSHRIRHGICQTAGVERDGKLVSTAMTVALSEKAIIIGSVATAATHRKQGLASQCLKKLAAQNSEKVVMISPKNDSAEKLYTSLGFSVVDTLGEIILKG